MIVAMKKVALFCLAHERERTLSALQDLGVLHVVPFAPSTSAEMQQSRRDLSDIQETLTRLQEIAAAPASAAGALPGPKQALALVHEAQALFERRARAREALAACERELARLAPLGDFDPAALRRLQASGLAVRVLQLQPKAPLPSATGLTVVEIRRNANGLWAAAIGPLNIPVQGDPVALPDVGPREQGARRDALLKDLAAADRRLAEIAAQRAAIASVAAGLGDTIAFYEARDGMGSAPALAYLQGFCPADQVTALTEAARRHGWGLLAADPTADDAVPTLVRNPAWIRPIKAVFEMVGILPGHTEADISAVFLFFFSIFVAMIIGDAAYGAIVILGTLAARRKWRSAPAYPFNLMLILGVATVIWGLLTGTVFGIQPETLPRLLTRFSVPWLTDEKHVMQLCFLLGAIHLTIAHVWNTLRSLNSTKVLAQLGWIGVTWSMYFLANNLILNLPLPAWVPKILLGSVGVIAVFMTLPREFKTEWYNHIMLPLDVISNFVDVVSYVRLYAVGIASLAVARNFNLMAVGEQGIQSIGAGLLAAFVLVAGHGLNLVLSAMGILVHGVRLNTLEFSRHMGLQWAGFAYAPFRRSGQPAVMNASDATARQDKGEQA